MKFHLSTLVTIVDGHMISHDHMDSVYGILNYMTGDNLFTHQLVRASREAAPALIAQHPWLKGIVVPEGLDTQEKIADFLRPYLVEHGPLHEVTPLAPEDHTVIDPVAELKMLRPGANVIIAKTGEGDG